MTNDPSESDLGAWLESPCGARDHRTTEELDLTYFLGNFLAWPNTAIRDGGYWMTDNLIKVSEVPPQRVVPLWSAPSRDAALFGSKLISSRLANLSSILVTSFDAITGQLLWNGSTTVINFPSAYPTQFRVCLLADGGNSVDYIGFHAANIRIFRYSVPDLSFISNTKHNLYWDYPTTILGASAANVARTHLYILCTVQPLNPNGYYQTVLIDESYSIIATLYSGNDLSLASYTLFTSVGNWGIGYSSSGFSAINAQGAVRHFGTASYTNIKVQLDNWLVCSNSHNGYCWAYNPTTDETKYINTVSILVSGNYYYNYLFGYPGDKLAVVNDNRFKILQL